MKSKNKIIDPFITIMGFHYDYVAVGYGEVVGAGA